MNKTRVDRLNELGYEYWIADPGASIKYGHQALEIAKILPYETGVAYANRIIGVAHWAQGNLDLSFHYLIAARKGYQELEDALGVANSSLNLGMAYADQRNFDLAKRNYEDALQFFRQEGADSRVATTYTKIADLLILLEKYTPAFDYLNQALVIHRRTGFLYGVAEANQKLGQLAMSQEEWDDAISYFLLAADAGKQRNDQVGLAGNYLGIGKAYFIKNNLGLAEDYLNRAKKLAEKFGLQRIRRDVYLAYKNLEARRGNFRQALLHADAYLNVRDSLFNREKSNLIANMEARRAYEAQEEELVLAQKNLDLLVKENKISGLTKWLLVLGLLTVIAIAYALLSRKDRVIARKGADLEEAYQRGNDLETVLKGKEQELTSYTLNFVQKNEGITELKRLLQNLNKRVSHEHRTELKSIVRKLEGLLRVDEDWADFRRHFESVHPDLIRRLGEEFPGLTSNEFRLTSLVRLNLSTKEISAVLGISPDSVKTARYRLRKKFNLDTQDSLFDFLLQHER
ncbi:tetratricopeptide repeat protein [Neolewinella persica]|uniref:tetratricopeptide repeat protein n=1 Tax=Neolewinella persica TaxID=70998 RepID=UPI00146B6081|nr:tetratricopeptide repeat protein [Neolewinella persica]